MLSFYTKKRRFEGVPYSTCKKLKTSIIKSRAKLRKNLQICKFSSKILQIFFIFIQK